MRMGSPLIDHSIPVVPYKALSPEPYNRLRTRVTEFSRFSRRVIRLIHNGPIDTIFSGLHFRRDPFSGAANRAPRVGQRQPPLPEDEPAAHVVQAAIPGRLEEPGHSRLLVLGNDEIRVP